MGYPDWWDHNRDQRKNDSKKTSIAIVAEIKTKANVAEKASALVAATNYGGKFLNTFTPIINSAWIIDSGATNHMNFDSRQVSPLRLSSQKIVSTANGNTTLKQCFAALLERKTLLLWLHGKLITPSISGLYFETVGASSEELYAYDYHGLLIFFR